METKDEYTESHTYLVDILNNGITLSIPEDEVLTCEKFGEGNDMDAIYKLLGKHLWNEIISYSNYKIVGNINIDISISENK